MQDGLFLVENQKTVSNFLSKEIPADILSQILNCARITPTNKHMQEWKFVVIKNDETKTKLANITSVECFNSAPVVIAFFSKNNKFKIEYASAATQTMRIIAGYYNLGTYWHIAYNEPYVKEVYSLLNAPNGQYLMGLIAIGFYSFANPQIIKMPSLSEMTINEKFK